MSRLTALTISLGITLAVSACRSGGPAEERSPGETAFRSRCQSCHRLPKRSEKDAVGWQAWLAEHRDKAGLSETETAEVLSYLSAIGQL